MSPLGAGGRTDHSKFKGGRSRREQPASHKEEEEEEGDGEPGEQMSTTKSQRPTPPPNWSEGHRLGLRHPREQKKSQGEKGERLTVGHAWTLEATPPSSP